MKIPAPFPYSPLLLSFSKEIMEKDAERLGARVRTTTDAGSDDWSDLTRSTCKWGVSGKIIDYSNSHGLCYKVRHQDGSVAWYEPGELELDKGR